MKVFSEILLFALIAALLQNLLFAGGIGAHRVLRVSKKPKDLLKTAGFITLFATAASLAAPLFRRLAGGEKELARFEVFFYIAFVVVFYLIVLYGVRLFSRRMFERLSPMLASCVFHGAVISVPLIAQEFQFSIPQAIGFGLGAGAGFLIAALLVMEALDRIDNPQMPESMIGLPALFLYIGILSMAFLGFLGAPYLYV